MDFFPNLEISIVASDHHGTSSASGRVIELESRVRTPHEIKKKKKLSVTNKTQKKIHLEK